jgi:hypothetical protein
MDCDPSLFAGKLCVCEDGTLARFWLNVSDACADIERFRGRRRKARDPKSKLTKDK